MIIKVLKPFTDKYTLQPYEAGELLKVSPSRGEELLNDDRNLVEEVKEKKRKVKEG